MTGWLAPALGALFLYGLWGFFPKLAVTYIRPESAIVYEVIGALIVGLAVLGATGLRLETDVRGVVFAVLTGVAGIAGTLLFFMAARTGSLPVVVSLTALYPVISILLAALFLNEPVSLRQAAGIALSFAAIYLMSG